MIIEYGLNFIVTPDLDLRDHFCNVALDGMSQNYDLRVILKE